MSTTIFGVDPGLVHTGVVALEFSPKQRSIGLAFEVIDDKDTSHAELAELWIDNRRTTNDRVFIESYRERGNQYSTDTKMRQLLREFRLKMPGATVLDNTGVKRVVTPPLMRVLGVGKGVFPTTHHQDLESAARILLYGMVKDDRLNAVLARIVADHLDGNPWDLPGRETP